VDLAAYVELCLRLGRHVEGLVDAYYGPAEVAERVDSEPLRDPAALATDAARLLETLDDEELDAQRRRWLQAQLVGLETVAQRLAGEEISYEDEVERCYGIRPQLVPEEEFEAAHRELDEALPGSGPLAERYQAWREGDGLRGESLVGMVDGLAAELRSRTAAQLGLPAGETVEFEYVTDKPWAAFNYYLGDLRSRIEFNTDGAMTPDFVLELVAHECYAGHHTEHAWKEQRLVREGGRAEESVFMVGTPQSLVSEGIAGLASEILLGDEEEEVTAAHVPPNTAYDIDQSRAVKHARHPLAGVGGNAALLLHANGVAEDEVRDYIMHWGLFSERRAEQALRFITDPVWRSYSMTYASGYQLCRDFVARDPERFKRLLTEQLTPADLV
jgi:hypothetical protein